MTTYVGFRDQTGHAHVAVDHSGELRPLGHFVRHSPAGMDWGYVGSGPADLARSLLAHFLGSGVAPHPRIYQRFKCLVIASLPRDQDWALTSEDVQSALDDTLDQEGVTCALCADQGQIWPDQSLSHGARRILRLCTRSDVGGRVSHAMPSMTAPGPSWSRLSVSPRRRQGSSLRSDPSG